MKIKVHNGKVLATSVLMPVFVCYAVGFAVVVAPVLILGIVLTLFGYPDPDTMTGLMRIRVTMLLLVYWIVFSLSAATMGSCFVTLGSAILKMRGKKIEIENVDG